MNKAGVFQAGLLLAVVWLLVRPLGAYLERVFERKKTSLDPLLLPVERLRTRPKAPSASCWQMSTTVR